MLTRNWIDVQLGEIKIKDIHSAVGFISSLDSYSEVFWFDVTNDDATRMDDFDCIKLQEDIVRSWRRKL